MEERASARSEEMTYLLGSRAFSLQVFEFVRIMPSFVVGTSTNYGEPSPFWSQVPSKLEETLFKTSTTALFEQHRKQRVLFLATRYTKCIAHCA